MLTNLEWLSEGKEFPPKCEQSRLKLYEVNEALFLTKHPDVWENAFRELAKRLRKKDDHKAETIFNYHQLLSKKTADFVCGEPPTLETKASGDELSKVLRKQRFFSKLYEAVIDISRFGNGIPKIVEDRLTIVQPKYWYPVLDPADLKRVTQHIIAYPTAPDDSGNPTKLYVEIHEVGSVEIREYSFAVKEKVKTVCGVTVGTIGNLITPEKKESTSLDDFAVQPLTNLTHSGSIYGLDDYAIINSLVEKLMWRLFCADKVLDKHSDPSLSGPSSALEYDERTGLYFMNLASYFARENKDAPDVSYITWDGNLDANFKEIDLLFNQLYVLSEMGTAFMEGGDAGAASSGTALKLRLVSPRIKAQRITGLNDAPVRTLIHLLAQVNGLFVDADDLQITWHDGLPDDPVEDAGRRSVETGGKPTKSQWSAIKERGLSDDAVDEELEQIHLEAAANSANVISVSDPTTEPFGDEQTGEQD